MVNDFIEIENAKYVGICLYNRLRKTIVEIEGEFVSIEDKKVLGLYLGILHTENSISNKMIGTIIKLDTNIGYKSIDEYEYSSAYETCFKDYFNNASYENIEDYFSSLLNEPIIIKLNREYNFNPYDIIGNGNKQLIKK